MNRKSLPNSLFLYFFDGRIIKHTVKRDFKLSVLPRAPLVIASCHSRTGLVCLDIG